MSVVIHRAIKAPTTKQVEPVGEAHYDLVTALVTGVFLQSDEDAGASSGAAAGGGGGIKKVILTEENIPGLNFYERLGLDPLGISVGPEQVKKAYHKALLTYHPDKTGRGDEDEVFLAIQEAHDTLCNETKRRAYDSLNDFDDTIPTGNEVYVRKNKKTGEEETNFYDVFGPVFHSNGRFASKVPVPLLGDDNTPFEDVFKFYEYWEVFESWRDFSLSNQEHDPEQADSREEKRWMIKENMKGVKQLKKKDNQRIINLVDRAKQKDPRLARAIQAEKAAKQAIKDARRREKDEAANKIKFEAEEKERLAKEKELAAKALAKQQKELREKNKKAMRQIRAYLRRLTVLAQEWHEANNGKKKEEPNMTEYDVDEVCEVYSADLEKLQSLLDQFGELENKEGGPTQVNGSPEGLKMGLAALRQAQADARQAKIDEQERLEQEKAERAALAQQKIDEENQKKAESMKWNKEELSWLAKGAKKFPAGSANRWETVANYINQQMRLADPKTKEMCLTKFTQIQKAVGTEGAAEAGVDGADSASGGGAAVPPTPTPPAAAAVPPKPTPAAAAASKPTTPEEDAAGAVWSKAQQKQLEVALTKYPATMEKVERWNAVSKEVEGKTKKQCVERFKYIRAKLAAAKGK